MCIKTLIYICIFMWNLVTRVSLLFPLSLVYALNEDDDGRLDFFIQKLYSIKFSVVVYFIGEYALSLCEYSSKPSMDASASGGTLKPSVIFSVTNKHAYEATAVYTAVATAA